jgi:hypothetical protein
MMVCWPVVDRMIVLLLAVGNMAVVCAYQSSPAVPIAASSGGSGAIDASDGPYGVPRSFGALGG